MRVLRQGLATTAGLGSSSSCGFRGDGGVGHVVFVCCSCCWVYSIRVQRTVALILYRTKLNNMVLASSFTLSRSTNTIPFRVPHGCRPQGRRPTLRVVVLDAAAVVARGAAHAAVPSPGAAAVSPPAAGRLVAAQAQEEEHGGEEEGRPGGPGEAEGVLAEGGGAAIGLEGITGLDKGGTLRLLVN